MFFRLRDASHCLQRVQRIMVVRRPKRASVLVCVLVVLMLVGMLAAQTMQTLVIVRRGDAQRMRVRQAKELIELGRAMLQTRVDRSPLKSIEVVVDAERQLRGQIQFIDQTAGSEMSLPVRVVVIYPSGDSNAAVVSRTFLWSPNPTQGPVQ